MSDKRMTYETITKKMIIKKRILMFVTIVAVLLLLITGKGLLNTRKDAIKNETLPSTHVLNVALVKAKQGLLENRVSFLAQVFSDKSINLSTKLAGYVEKVLVEESQKVKKGDILVRIDAIEIRSSIDALKSTLQAQEGDLVLVKSIYARNKKLYAVGGLSKEQLSTSKVAVSLKSSALESTKQKIDQLKHQLSYLQIVAPFDGEIDAILMHEGDLAAVGKPILTMSNSKKKLVFSYSPVKHALIKKEQDVFFDNRQVGYVKTIYTVSQNGLTSAEVTLNKPISVPSGASIKIEVLTEEKKGCLLPDNTLLHKKEGTFVMQYVKKAFIPEKVTVEMQNRNSVLISPCPQHPVAQASEVKLAQLPGYGNVAIAGVK